MDSFRRFICLSGYRSRVGETLRLQLLATSGSKGTVLLVGNRYQVQVRSITDAVDEASRKTWLQKFDLAGLEQLDKQFRCGSVHAIDSKSNQQVEFTMAQSIIELVDNLPRRSMPVSLLHALDWIVPYVNLVEFEETIRAISGETDRDFMVTEQSGPRTIPRAASTSGTRSPACIAPQRRELAS